MFISEIVHTEDPFSIKLCYKLNFATEPKKLIKDLGIIQESNKTFMDALKQGSLNNSITKLTENLDKKYDLILMDSIPTTSFYTNNCLMASDFAIVPVKTDEDCYEQVLPYMTYLSTIREYNKNLDVIGIIPYLAQNNIDMNYLSKFKKVYGNLVYDNIINWDKRVLAWSTSSITTNISNNKIQMRWYDKVLQKTIVRAKDLLSDGNNE
ncbi:ParA family protein [Staphylococcus coagulans]|uniref:ParA family protein n=2 Tax=Staphylococcus coagulans TaxID=74706 RepID=UPI001C0BA691|nr:ParA family protein [Staphylococcus coagulans]